MLVFLWLLSLLLRGFRVVDFDLGKIEAVNDGECYLREANLNVLLGDVITKSLLGVTNDGVETVRS